VVGGNESGSRGRMHSMTRGRLTRPSHPSSQRRSDLDLPFDRVFSSLFSFFPPPLFPLKTGRPKTEWRVDIFLFLSLFRSFIQFFHACLRVFANSDMHACTVHSFIHSCIQTGRKAFIVITSPSIDARRGRWNLCTDCMNNT